ncbi:hypothetical protein BBJ28_00011198 [Nothophytophthora sp. Chile5]|nr:hypothetical protein BBJ28_00011198 [Nothophytophthora sp. Chile5]
MGTASSRVLASGPTGSTPASSSWQELQCSLHYTAADLRLWPQLEPLALWFTAQDARRLLHRLRVDRAGTTDLLTLREFVQWLDEGRSHVDRRKDGRAKFSRAFGDTKTPPDRGNQRLHLLPEEREATTEEPPSILEKQLQHVFLTFASGSGDASRLYALEFLAALVVVSRAIWDVHEKVALLLELFHDPAASSSRSYDSEYSGYTPSQRLKETDVARLLLCVMNGVGRATQGVARVWETHGLKLAAVARQSAVHCVQTLSNAPSSSSTPSKAVGMRSIKTPASTRSVSSDEFRVYVARTPALREFLALFSGEELRNPLTFATLTTARANVARHKHQAQVYETLLRRYVPFDGRQERREASAAVLIQSTWRRRCSRCDAQSRAQARVAQRHASATRLQGFFKNRRAAWELEARAETERAALNGGVFAAGCGPSVASDQRVRGGAPLRLLAAFTTLNVKLSMLAASSTCALAVQDDGHSLFVWGRCLPRLRSDQEGEEIDENPTELCLTHMTPRRLRVQLTAPVLEVACGLRHALVLTSDGMVFSWGFNDHGQLGHGSAETLAARTSGRIRYDSYYSERSGENEPLLASPTRLMYFEGSAMQQAEPIAVAQICCGDYYSMARSREGDVFTWGEASEGQLGHGDSHEFFQVALADRHLLSSTYTFLAQPEPVLALSDVRVSHVACRGNHSVALSAEGSRLFEWGNWGTRRSGDSEHALLPEEVTGASELRLRRVAVGGQHLLAEGASVWLKLASPATGAASEREQDAGFCVEPLAGASSSLDAIEREFVGKNVSERRRWVCCLVDLDLDDVGDDEEGGEASRPSSRPATAAATAAGSLWQRRAARFALTIDRLVEFDRRVVRLLAPSSTTDSYVHCVNQYFHGRVANRLVVLPRGKSSGFYLQFRLPLDSVTGGSAAFGSELDVADPRDEDGDDSEGKKTAEVVLELAVCGSNTAEHAVGRRGFATHVFHPAMSAAAKRLKQQQLRARSTMKKKPTAALTETNSLFVLEIDQDILDGPNSEDQDGSDARKAREGLSTESAAELEAETIVSEIGHRVLELQETGALAVLVVLDLFDADAFALQFAEDSGVFIPVFMVTRQTQAVFLGSSEDESALPPVNTLWTVQELLDHVLTSPTTLTPQSAAALPPRRPSVQSTTATAMLQAPPPLMARCFFRADTAAVRARSAFANGAAAVLFVASEVSEPSQEALKRSLTAALPVHAKRKHQLVGMLSYEHGRRLRAASHLASLSSSPEVSQQSSTQRWSLSDPNAPSRAMGNCELLVDVQFELRAGGTTYAWGNADNGRLGLGDPAVGTESQQPLFQDGYEALTDHVYRFVAQPTRVPALAGVELRQLACGEMHSLAVTTGGKVFSWGRGNRGQLGHAAGNAEGSAAAATDEWTPRSVRGLRYECVTQAVATDQSSLFLTEIVPSEVHEQRRRQTAQLRAIVKQSEQHGAPQVVEY